MTNLELVVSVLAAHREDRRWADEAVAADVVAKLGLDADAEHGVSAPVPEPTANKRQRNA